MDFVYPIDVAALRDLAQARGPAFVEHVGLEPWLRDDVALTRLVWAAGQGWFPVMPDRSPHFAVDLGLLEGEGGSWLWAPVVAIGEGEVVFVDRAHFTAEGYAFGRVIVRHPVPGGDAFALYQHLDQVRVHTGELVKAGTALGSIGWHGNFPHLHFAIASQAALGGDDLVPEAAATNLPAGEGVWNVARVQVERLDEDEWPRLPAEGPWYHYNPIEFVRWCRGEAPEHDAGPGTRHEVNLVVAQSSHDARIGRNNEAVCEMPLLQSAALSACEAWLRLAHDPAFASIGRGDPEPGPGAFEAVQKALKACGYELGHKGPAHDGVDGVFGPKMERVLKTFQDKRLRKLDLSLLARGPEDVKADGRIDWLTLMGLDAVAAAHKEAPPENLPTPAKEAPPVIAPPPPAEPLPPPPAGALVLDARAGSRRLSMEVGLRAYQALLDWSDESANPCGYSSPGQGALNDHYVDVVGKGFNEWPLLATQLGSKAKIEVDNEILKAKDVPKYYAFGVEWTGTHYTNCCNSQLAALAVGLGGGAFSVVTDSGEVAYDVTSDKPTMKVHSYDKKKKLVESTVPALRVFQVMAVCRRDVYFDDQGNDLFSMDEYGFPSGMRVLSLGESISKFTTDQADYAKLRIGDATHTAGHAFMIGDVRYGVWLTDDSDGRPAKKPANSTGPDYVCDQSGFIRAERPAFFRPYYGSPLYSVAAPPLSSAECGQIIAQETEFERRLQVFLAAREGGSLEVDTFIGSKDSAKPNATVKPKADAEKLTVKVARIEVLGWRCLSANGTLSTVHSSQWSPPDKKDPASTWSIDDDATTKARASGGIGIGRPWRKADKIAFGRYYGRKSA